MARVFNVLYTVSVCFACGRHKKIDENGVEMEEMSPHILELLCVCCYFTNKMEFLWLQFIFNFVNVLGTRHDDKLF